LTFVFVHLSRKTFEILFIWSQMALATRKTKKKQRRFEDFIT